MDKEELSPYAYGRIKRRLREEGARISGESPQECKKRLARDEIRMSIWRTKALVQRRRARGLSGTGEEHKGRLTGRTII